MISYDITLHCLPNATSLEYPHFVHSDAQFVRNIATRTPRLISTFLLTLHMYLLFEQHRKNLSPSTLRWGTENGEEHNSESRCDRVDFSNANTRGYSTTFLKNKILAGGDRIKRITKQLRRGLQGVRQHGRIWIDGG